MSSPIILPRVKPGDEITAALFNALRDAIAQCIILPGRSVGIRITQTDAGVAISVKSTQRFAGLTSGAISARSGSTPGTGTVELYALDTSNNLADQNTSLPVFNFSSGAIASGKYCWIEEDLDNHFWVISAEC